MDKSDTRRRHRLHRIWFVSDNAEGGYCGHLYDWDVEMLKLQKRMIEKYKITDEDFEEIVDLAKEINEHSHDYDEAGESL